jgi:hypothetical protein
VTWVAHHGGAARRDGAGGRTERPLRLPGRYASLRARGAGTPAGRRSVVHEPWKVNAIVVTIRVCHRNACARPSVTASRWRASGPCSTGSPIASVDISRLEVTRTEDLSELSVTGLRSLSRGWRFAAELRWSDNTPATRSTGTTHRHRAGTAPYVLKPVLRERRPRGRRQNDCLASNSSWVLRISPSLFSGNARSTCMTVPLLERGEDSLRPTPMS